MPVTARAETLLTLPGDPRQADEFVVPRTVDLVVSRPLARVQVQWHRNFGGSMKNRLIPALLALATTAACGGEEEVLQSTTKPGVAAGPTLDGGSSDAASGTVLPPIGQGVGRTGDAASPGASPGTGLLGGDAAAPVCQQFSLLTQRVKPEMLIVLDRSGSMKELDKGINRWDPSVSGLKKITSTFDTTIDFGLMVFPGTLNGVFNGKTDCVPGTVEVPIGVTTSAPIATRLDMMTLVNTTPTASTLAAAHASMAMRPPIVDGKRGAPFIVLVTDGAPNCANNNGGDSTGTVEKSVEEIMSMAKDGIRTYVLGYDTQKDAKLKTALDSMAAAGGTGDTLHRPIEDEAGLIAAFNAITASAVTCDYALKEPVKKPEYLSVELTGKPVSRSETNGWSLSADMLTLSLKGAACDELRTQKTAALSVKVQCEVVGVF
jgi:hypothetical protein